MLEGEVGNSQIIDVRRRLMHISRVTLVAMRGGIEHIETLVLIYSSFYRIALGIMILY